MFTKSRAEVIIIGAGVIGTSIAYHLAKAGCHDVIVLEKDAIGEGSTGKCAGGVRQQFAQEVNIRLSMEGVKFFERFEEETGHPDDFRQYGYMMLATTEDILQSLRRNLALQQNLGVEIYLLPPKGAQDLIPELNIEDVIAATYCPTDGFVDPYSVVQGFASECRRLGVKICTETEVTGLSKMNGNKVITALTANGEFEAPIVVNAAGPYAGLVGKMVGLDIPVRPSKQHKFFTEPTDKFPQKAPLVIDTSASIGIRREGQCIMFSLRDPKAPVGFDTTVDWGVLPAIGEAILHRFPALKEVGIMRAEAGLKSNTPDFSAILGEVPEVEGLYLACGFSGHGLMHSPAVGRLVAAHILGEEDNPAISSLSLARFKDGKLMPETL